jgi:2-polyprenyl-3-methyl-5-hydroxy-6-metoxy-1,4-benzoquinol methylase
MGMPRSRYATTQRPGGERRRLLERAPPAATVLDVGCWSGFNGDHLLSSRACTVDGVEPDAAMAELAARTYRRVHVCTLEEALAGPLADARASYDVILLMDVLEHLIDPEGALRACATLVSPGGQLLVSVPNVAHWSVRKRLLTGHWEYEDSGILDRTHLHFFTFATAERLAAKAGLTVSWRGAALDRPPLIALGERHRWVLRPWPGLFAAQILFDLRT